MVRGSVRSTKCEWVCIGRLTFQRHPRRSIQGGKYHYYTSCTDIFIGIGTKSVGKECGCGAKKSRLGETFRPILR